LIQSTSLTDLWSSIPYRAAESSYFPQNKSCSPYKYTSAY